MIKWTVEPQQYLRHHLLVEEVLVLLCTDDAAKGDLLFVDLEGETVISGVVENHTGSRKLTGYVTQYYQAAIFGFLEGCKHPAFITTIISTVCGGGSVTTINGHSSGQQFRETDQYELNNNI